MTRTNPAGRLHRWSLTLQEYEFTIAYRPGTTNVVADALSRAPVAVLAATGKKRRQRRVRAAPTAATEEKTEENEPATSAEARTGVDDDGDGLTATPRAARAGPEPADAMAATTSTTQQRRTVVTTDTMPPRRTIATTDEASTTGTTTAAAGDGTDGESVYDASAMTTMNGSSGTHGEHASESRHDQKPKEQTTELEVAATRPSDTSTTAPRPQPSTARQDD